MIGMSRLERIILPTIAVLAILLVGTSFAAQAVATLVCGRPFDAFTLLGSATFVLTQNVDRAYGSIEGCTIEPAAIWASYFVVIVVLMVIGLVAAILWRRYKESERYFRSDLLKRQGFAQSREIVKWVSERAMLKRARTLRPTVKDARASDVSWRVGVSRGVGVRISTEQSMALWGPPRSGKGYRILIGAILDAIGSVVTTSTRADNLAATYEMRKKRGPVVVFDPQGISGIASAMRWSPIVGSEDPETATRRAGAILAGEPASKGSNAEWAKASSIIAAGLLHAAAVGDKEIEDLRDWTSNPGMAKRAVAILESDGTDGWAGRLEGVLSGDPRLLDSNWHSLRSAFDPLFLPRIATAMSPGKTDRFDAREFLKSDGTLYLIDTGGVGAVGGFLSAMMNDVVAEARKMAMASPGGRFDPGLSLILDELFNLFAWTELPQVMSDGGGAGISSLVVMQSLSQARDALGPSAADTIWSSANVKLLLGGAGDADDMRDFSDLLGPRFQRRMSKSYTESGTSWSENENQVPLVSVDELRRLPDGLGVMTSKNLRPILLDVGGWTERKDADAIGRGKSTTEAEQFEVLTAKYGNGAPGVE